MSRKPKGRVLVVDDHLDSAQSLAMLLRLGGHDTQDAQTQQCDEEPRDPSRALDFPSSLHVDRSSFAQGVQDVLT